MKKCGTKCPERDEGNRDQPLRPASLYNLIHNEFSRHSGHTMSKHPLLLGLTLLSASLFTGQAFADRTVTDQLGRQVTLPDHVTRVVVLQHQTLNLLVQLHAAEDIVGVLSSW
ncbi:hypothetical protein PG930_22745, partial [Klebsiella pneumoniae]